MSQSSLVLLYVILTLHKHLPADKLDQNANLFLDNVYYFLLALYQYHITI